PLIHARDRLPEATALGSLRDPRQNTAEGFQQRSGQQMLQSGRGRIHPQGLAALRSGVVGWRETWVRGNVECWDELIGQRRGRIGDSVVSKERYLDLIGNFLEGAKHIPKWAIAHAEDGFVTAAEMGEVIRQFRPVEVAYNKDFSEVVGGLNTYLILA